jgi:hypothetical protein
MDTCLPLKEKGFEVHFKISLQKNKYLNYPFFKEIFDEETINFFDSIEETPWSNSSRTIDGCEYYASIHQPQEPGQHHWDIFIDQKDVEIEMYLYDANRANSLNKRPKSKPNFNKEILEMADSFSNKLPDDYQFLHIRVNDNANANVDRYLTLIEEVKIFVEKFNTKIHLGSNNKFVIDQLKEEDNVFTFDFDYLDKIDNDMNSFWFWGGNLQQKSENPTLIERMKKIIAEMVSIKNSKRIILYSDMNWISNFLFYAIVNSEQKIELVSFNHAKQFG